jgi:ABC-type amino acid transport system permease subunit
VHGLARSPRRGWIEQLAVAAGLCIGLPMLGFLVPNSALPAMIAAGDWNTAGVDLTTFVLGLLLAIAAYVVAGRRVAAVPKPRRLAPA